MNAYLRVDLRQFGTITIHALIYINIPLLYPINDIIMLL